MHRAHLVGGAQDGEPPLQDVECPGAETQQLINYSTYFSFKILIYIHVQLICNIISLLKPHIWIWPVLAEGGNRYPWIRCVWNWDLIFFQWMFCRGFSDVYYILCLCVHARAHRTTLIISYRVTTSPVPLTASYLELVERHLWNRISQSGFTDCGFEIIISHRYAS